MNTAQAKQKKCPHCHSDAKRVLCRKCRRTMCEECIHSHWIAGKVCVLCLDRLEGKPSDDNEEE